MISRSALSTARDWCGPEPDNFAKVSRRCLSYLRVTQSILGLFETQAEKDKAFLMLFRCELEHLHEDDESDERSRTSWMSA
jgi:hypothetical protein